MNYIWEQQTYLSESLTMGNLSNVLVDLIDRGKYIQRIGQRYQTKLSETLYVQLPALAVLSCLVEQAIRVHSLLQSWIMTNELENGRTLLTNVNKASDGYAACLQTAEIVSLMITVLGMLERIYD